MLVKIQGESLPVLVVLGRPGRPGRPGAQIDFQYRERVNFFSHSVLLFHNFFGSRTLVNLTRREAGENPVLPRNCKRGNRNRSLG